MPGDGRHLKCITFDDEGTMGYLSSEVEEHKSSKCSYKETEVEWIKTGCVYGGYYRKTYRRYCFCARNPQEKDEYHFYEDGKYSKCQWKRYVDQTDGISYLVRRCYCDPDLL